MQNPIFWIVNSIEKSNFINDDIKEKEINEYVIEKSDLINKMNPMNPMMDQMDMNQMNSMMMNNSMNSQMGMNNQMNLNQMDMINSPMNSMMGQMDMNQNITMMTNMMNQMDNDNQMNHMAMIQMQNNNQSPDEEKINDIGIYGINLTFRKEGGSHIKFNPIIQCCIDEKVSDVIQRYRAKSGDNDPTNKFIFNAKNLNQNLTVAEVGMTKNANIFVVSTKGIKGAGGIPLMFTDLSKNKTKEIGLSKKAPSYRKVTKGINIFGICNFKKCKAYKKEVVVRIKKKKLDLIKERDELFCPECEATIIPKTVGFYLCKFMIYGKKLVDDQVERFEKEEDEANKKDSLKYFDPELNGEVTVIELIFEVLEYL